MKVNYISCIFSVFKLCSVNVFIYFTYIYVKKLINGLIENLIINVDMF